MSYVTGGAVLSRAVLLGILDRALKAFAQTLVTLLAAGPALDVLHLAIWSAVGLAGGAAVMSLLTSLASLPLGDPGSTAAIPGAH